MKDFIKVNNSSQITGGSDCIIKVQNVSKIFKISRRAAGIPGMLANMIAPKYEKKQAVKDISFDIEQGEMVGFIGPNGA